MINLAISDRCNNNCLFCTDKGMPGSASYRLADIKEYLRRISHEGAIPDKDVFITSHEPTLNPEFLDILRYLKASGYRTTLNTNARVFSHRRTAETARSLVHEFRISVHGSDEATHDAITQAPGSFRQTISAMHNLKGSIITTNTVICSMNVLQLESILILLDKAGSERIDFTGIKPVGAAAERPELLPEYGAVKRSLLRVKGLAERRRIAFSVSNIPLCVYSQRFKEAQRVEPFFYSSNGLKINLDTFAERQKIRLCSSCRHRKGCEGLYVKYIERYGDDIQG